VYLSSADWMPRNLNRRVELMFPVLQEDLKHQVREILQAQLADNSKARLLKPDGSYEKVQVNRAEKLRVQEYLYRKTLEEHNHIQSLTPVQFTPKE
jgi:polyphosphate kinase